MTWKKERRHVALSSTLPFMFPHLGTVLHRLASPHQIPAPSQTHIDFSPEGVTDSAIEHICPLVFITIPIYPCPLSLICHHLAFKTQAAMTRVFTVKGWRSTVSSYQRAFMYSQWLEWGYWCASRGHDLGGKSLWKGVISNLSFFPFWTGHLLTIISWLTACKSDALLKLHTVV